MASQLLELTRHSAIYGIGGLTSRFLSVIMLPLYTTYISAGDYGRIELLMAIMAVVVVVLRGGANFGFVRFYFLEKDPEYRRRLIRTVFWAQMTYSTCALIVFILFASQLARWIGVAYVPGAHLQGSGASLIVATAVLLWANVNYLQMTNLFRVEQRSLAFSLATVANVAVTIGITAILVVVYHKGPLGIIVGNFSGTLVIYLVLLAYRREQLGLQFDRKLLRNLNRFGFPLLGAGLAMWVMNFGDRVMLRKLLHGAYAVNQLGQYSIAYKIASALVLLFTAFQIAWPAFAYSIEDDGEAKRTYAFVLTYLMYVAAWAAVGLSLFAPWIVRLVGRQPGYWPGAAAVPALVFSSVFFAGFIVVTIAIGRTRQTQSNWIAAVAGAGVNFGLNFWLIPAYGMLGAAYATLAATVTLLVVRLWNAQRLFPISYQWRRVALMLAAAGGLTAAGEFLPRSLPVAAALSLAYPLLLLPLGFYLPAERRKLRRLLPARN